MFFRTRQHKQPAGLSTPAGPLPQPADATAGETDGACEQRAAKAAAVQHESAQHDVCHDVLPDISHTQSEPGSGQQQPSSAAQRAHATMSSPGFPLEQPAERLARVHAIVQQLEARRQQQQQQPAPDVVPQAQLAQKPQPSPPEQQREGRPRRPGQASRLQLSSGGTPAAAAAAEEVRGDAVSAAAGAAAEEPGAPSVRTANQLEALVALAAGSAREVLAGIDAQLLDAACNQSEQQQQQLLPEEARGASSDSPPEASTVGQPQPEQLAAGAAEAPSALVQQQQTGSAHGAESIVPPGGAPPSHAPARTASSVAREWLQQLSKPSSSAQHAQPGTAQHNEQRHTEPAAAEAEEGARCAGRPQEAVDGDPHPVLQWQGRHSAPAAAASKVDGPEEGDAPARARGSRGQACASSAGGLLTVEQLQQQLEAQQVRRQQEVDTMREQVTRVKQLYEEHSSQQQLQLQEVHAAHVEQQQQHVRELAALREQHARELQQALDGPQQELLEARGRHDALQHKLALLQLELQRSAATTADLQDRVTRSLAERAELQRQVVEHKQQHQRLHEENLDLKLLATSLQEQQEQQQLDELRAREARRAQAHEQQEQLRQQQHQLLQREAHLEACQQQLEAAKAALQAEVEQQHGHIRSMLQQLQAQEQAMIADVRSAKATYAADLKSEGQRFSELQAAHEQLGHEHAETAGRLKRLQRDHARLLDRKLECDRRISSLQFKLSERAASADKAPPGDRSKPAGGGGGAWSKAGGAAAGAAAPPATTADAAAREHQQAALAAHAALALVRAEQDARRAAEKKAAELQLENGVLNELVAAWVSELDSPTAAAKLGASVPRHHQHEHLTLTVSPIKGLVVDATAATLPGGAAAAAAAATLAGGLTRQQQQQHSRTKRSLRQPLQAPREPADKASSPIFKASAPGRVNMRMQAAAGAADGVHTLGSPGGQPRAPPQQATAASSVVPPPRHERVAATTRHASAGAATAAAAGQPAGGAHPGLAHQGLRLRVQPRGQQDARRSREHPQQHAAAEASAAPTAAPLLSEQGWQEAGGPLHPGGQPPLGASYSLASVYGLASPKALQTEWSSGHHIVPGLQAFQPAPMHHLQQQALVQWQAQLQHTSSIAAHPPAAAAPPPPSAAAASAAAAFTARAGAAGAAALKAFVSPPASESGVQPQLQQPQQQPEVGPAPAVQLQPPQMPAGSAGAAVATGSSWQADEVGPGGGLTQQQPVGAATAAVQTALQQLQHSRHAQQELLAGSLVDASFVSESSAYASALGTEGSSSTLAASPREPARPKTVAALVLAGQEAAAAAMAHHASDQPAPPVSAEPSAISNISGPRGGGGGPSSKQQQAALLQQHWLDLQQQMVEVEAIFARLSGGEEGVDGGGGGVGVLEEGGSEQAALLEAAAVADGDADGRAPAQQALPPVRVSVDLCGTSVAVVPATNMCALPRRS